MPFDPNRVGVGSVHRLGPIYAEDIGDRTAGDANNVQAFLDARRFILGTVASLAARDALTDVPNEAVVLVASNGDGKPEWFMWDAGGNQWRSTSGAGGSNAMTLQDMSPSDTAGTASSVVVRKADGTLDDLGPYATKDSRPFATMWASGDLSLASAGVEVDSVVLRGAKKISRIVLYSPQTPNGATLTLNLMTQTTSGGAESSLFPTKAKPALAGTGGRAWTTLSGAALETVALADNSCLIARLVGTAPAGFVDVRIDLYE